MAVTLQTPIVNYDGSKVDGQTTVFPFDFQLIDASDLDVRVNGVRQLATTYKVDIQNNQGGNVTFNTAPAAGSEIMLRRATPFKRDTDYQDNGDLIADEIDADFDRIWLALQEQKASSDTTLNKPIGGSAWDAGGFQIENLGDGIADTDAATVGQVRTLNGGAQNSANAAAASQAAAAASAGQAATNAQATLANANKTAADVISTTKNAADAATSAIAAAGEADTAHKWATNPEDAEVAGGEFSAFHWAAKSRKSATAAATSETNAAASATAAAADAAAAAASNPANQLLKSANLSDLADKAAAWLNVRPIGATPLAGDGQADFDAVTVRQLRQASGGGGANVSGVMNNFIGAVEWYMGGRTKFPAGYLPGDGQTVKRSDVPDVVAAMKAGMLLVVDAGTGADAGKTSDQMWQATPGVRGRFTWGDGDESTGTTIRLPDLNGVWSHPTDAKLNSIAGLFLRGDGRGQRVPAENGGLGTVRANAAPNIKGAFQSVDIGGNEQPTGAMYQISSNTAYIGSGGQASDEITGFDASKYNPTYSDAATEIRPNSVQGVWLIRVNGSFTAAGTSYEVITAEATAPAQGASIEGGKIISRLDVAGKKHITADFSVRGNYLNDGWASFHLRNEDLNAVNADMQLHPYSWLHLVTQKNPTGDTTGGYFISRVEGSAAAAMYSQQWANGNASVFFQMYKDGDTSYRSRTMELSYKNDLILYPDPTTPTPNNQWRRGGAFVSRAGDNSEFASEFGSFDNPGVDRGAIISAVGQQYFFLATGPNAGCISAPTGILRGGGSDIELKKDVVDAATGGLERVLKMRPREFTWKAGEYRDRGFIAQEMEAIDPIYTFKSSNDGPLNVSDRAIIADLIASIQALKAEIEELKKVK